MTMMALMNVQGNPFKSLSLGWKAALLPLLCTHRINGLQLFLSFLRPLPKASWGRQPYFSRLGKGFVSETPSTRCMQAPFAWQGVRVSCSLDGLELLRWYNFFSYCSLCHMSHVLQALSCLIFEILEVTFIEWIIVLLRGSKWLIHWWYPT